MSKVEDLIRHIVRPGYFRMTVSNIGVVDDFSSLYTTNAGEYTATVQTQLTDDHKISSFTYMDRVSRALATQYPELRTFISRGSMHEAILTSGMPAAVDDRITGNGYREDYDLARQLAAQIRQN